MKRSLIKRNFIPLLVQSVVSAAFLLLNMNNAIAQNPMAAAQDFNVFVQEDLTITSGDIEGAIGVGGNFRVQGVTNRPSTNATGKQAYVTIGGIKYALIVGGTLFGSNGNRAFTIDGKSGATDDHYVRINNLNGSNNESNNSGINIGKPANDPSFRYIRINQTIQDITTVENNTAVTDFSTAFTSFRNESSRISTKGNNVTVSNSGGQANITLGANAVNVWNVTGVVLNSFSQINLSGVLPSAANPLLINVNATGTFNWSNVRFTMQGESDNYMEVNRAPYIIWNFYNNTTAINLLQANLFLGSVLAPDARITSLASGNMTGQLVAKSFDKPNAGELHIAKFDAVINAGVLSSGSITLSPFYYNNQVTLNWQTAGDINAALFEAERSYNGTAFEKIGAINAAAANGGNAAYTVTDKNINNNAGILYYRIKVTDKNGITSYSALTTLHINKENEVSVWPNPFVSKVSFNYNASNSGAINTRITDITGKTIKTQNFSVYKGLNGLTITDLQGIEPGNYFIEITDTHTGKKVNVKTIKI